MKKAIVCMLYWNLMTKGSSLWNICFSICAQLYVVIMILLLVVVVVFHPGSTSFSGLPIVIKSDLKKPACRVFLNYFQEGIVGVWVDYLALGQSSGSKNFLGQQLSILALISSQIGTPPTSQIQIAEKISRISSMSSEELL